MGLLPGLSVIFFLYLCMQNLRPLLGPKIAITERGGGLPLYGPCPISVMHFYVNPIDSRIDNRTSLVTTMRVKGQGRVHLSGGPSVGQSIGRSDRGVIYTTQTQLRHVRGHHRHLFYLEVKLARHIKVTPCEYTHRVRPTVRAEEILPAGTCNPGESFALLWRRRSARGPRCWGREYGTTSRGDRRLGKFLTRRYLEDWTQRDVT